MMRQTDTQESFDVSALSTLGSLHDQHHLDASMEVPITSGSNCPLTGIATPVKRPYLVEGSIHSRSTGHKKAWYKT